jgi:hypothetical protein
VKSYFEDVESVLEDIRDAAPDISHVAPEEECDPMYVGRRARWRWDYSSYVVEVDVSRIQFMPDNTWRFEHAAGVIVMMQEGSCFEPPAARIHRITAEDVKSTQRYEKSGELEYQTGMIRPWTKADIGQYTALLIDGNHRAAAAMVLGERAIPVYVGENYRAEVRKKDWL